MINRRLASPCSRASAASRSWRRRSFSSLRLAIDAPGYRLEINAALGGGLLRGARRAPRATACRVGFLDEGGELVVQATRVEAPFEDRVGVNEARVGHFLHQGAGVGERVEGIAGVTDD